MKQPKRVIGYDQDYPGSYHWPIYEVKCPACNKWSSEYGDVDERQGDGSWWMLCTPCGNKVE